MQRTSPDHAATGGLDGAMSLYLDLVRLVAAMTVFIGHVSGHRFTGGLLWQVGPYMSQAVAVFFVLSGFVIAYATDSRETSASAYVVSRAARIYSVALPALVITFVLDAIGRSIQPDLYSPVWGYHAAGRGWQFAANLLFVNQLWFLDVPPGSDLPYWSLGYEVWYYVLFGIFIFARRRWMMIPTVLVFVGPKIAAMFPLWLIGVFCYHRCRQRRRIGLGLGLLLWASSLAAWTAYEVLARYYGRLPGLASSRWLLPELTEDYLVGSLFAANLLGFDAASRIFGPVLRLVAQPIRWAAGGTFTLYLVHLPIAQFLAAVAPWAPDTWRTRVWILGGTLAAVFLAAEGTERRKRIWRRVFVAVLRAPLRTAAR